MGPPIDGKKLLASLVWLCLAASCLAGDDYCRFKCSGGQHTMCLFKQGAPGGKCLDYQNASLNDKERQDILHIHNSIRMDIANGNVNLSSHLQAADMMQLVWDDELAAVAQVWADQCSYQHDSCRRVGRFEVGQNVAMRTGRTQFPAEDMYRNIDMWFEEVEKLAPNIIDEYTSSESDHFTQLAWAATGAVGCGASIYRSGEAEYTELLVCNYGPSGNRPSLPVYKTGAPCSACPQDTSCSREYQGLCFSPEYSRVTRDPPALVGAAAVACGRALLVGVSAGLALVCGPTRRP
ncbi:venom allergen 5-like isoform X2 [Bacillus rossius redtenbacheri]|uniref:venom allergen 5-like isoform X2 n=1 Tax=Bacillus rossius redtenbacheri TaxID=93214 RepID=UPI002FDE760B